MLKDAFTKCSTIFLTIMNAKKCIHTNVQEFHLQQWMLKSVETKVT
jgi:hypothetical protein